MSRFVCFLRIPLVLFAWFAHTDGLELGEQAETKYGAIRECVHQYAQGLHDVKPGLGDSMMAHPLRPVQVSDRQIIFGAGVGTTGTRSLKVALGALGARVVHCCNTPAVTSIMAPYGLGASLEDRKPMSNKEILECRAALHSFNYASMPVHTDAFMDTPVAEVFLNLFLAYPRAKVILTTRNATEWVATRIKHHALNGFAPMQEPCGLFMQYPRDTFDVEELERLFELQNDLVRCLVPQQQLLEINVWTETPQRMEGFMDELADFLVLPRPNAAEPFPGHRIWNPLRENFRADCLGGGFKSTEFANTSQGVGRLIHRLVLDDCELD